MHIIILPANLSALRSLRTLAMERLALHPLVTQLQGQVHSHCKSTYNLTASRIGYSGAELYLCENVPLL
jgi:hypothetical protein